MITKFLLKFGRACGLAAEPIDTTPVTVFVGPNNSGKTKVLNEILQFCVRGYAQGSEVILDQIKFLKSDPVSAKKDIDHLTLSPVPSDNLAANNIIIRAKATRLQVVADTLYRCLVDPEQNVRYFCEQFLRYHIVFLDGVGRINLVHQQAAGDLQKEPATSLQVLFRDEQRRHEVRRILLDAFNLYFVIDPTNLGSLRMRFSSNPPSSDLEERGIHRESIEFHARARPIDEFSDGVKAFTGIITELIAGDPRVVLIDEPEAFLYPPLAFKLGYEVSRAALRSEKRAFISTHSSTSLVSG